MGNNPFAEDDIHVSSREARQMLGGVSDMTLWRWLQDEDLNFPRPILIARRRYWKLTELRAWLKERAAA